MGPLLFRVYLYSYRGELVQRFKAFVYECSPPTWARIPGLFEPGGHGTESFIHFIRYIQRGF